MKFKGCLLIFFLSFAAFFSFHQDACSQSLKDSLKAEKLKADTSVHKKTFDTLGTVPLYKHGSLFHIPDKSIDTISKFDFLLENYTTLTDIINDGTGSFPLNFGNYGGYNNFSLLGAMPRGTAYTFNGRQTSDPEYGGYNPEQIPVEFMEQAEILKGSKAVILTDNSTGIAVNIQEIRYNTRKPYTRMWYSQSAYGFIGSDGIYSQNVAPDFNTTIGFRSLSSAGRYNNSWLSSWNLRALFRWNPTNWNSISLVESFTNYADGENGGINKAQSPTIYDELEAIPNYGKNDERNFRHDLTLTYSQYLDTVNVKELTLAAYFTSSARTRTMSGEFVNLPADSILFYSYSSYFAGANGRYEHSFGKYASLNAGGEINYTKVPQTFYFNERDGYSTAAYGLGTINLPDVKLSGGIRASSMFGFKTLSYGANAEFTYGVFSVSADFSMSGRRPAPVEGLDMKQENHTLGFAEIKYTSESMIFSLTAFNRYIDAPILAQPVPDTSGKLIATSFYNGSSMNITGATLRFATSITHFGLDFSAQSYYSKIGSSEDKTFPALYSSLTLYYQVTVGRSYIKAGFTSSVLSKYNGYGFFPNTRAYYQNDQISLNAFNGLDIFAYLRLGPAYVRVTMRNALSSRFYYIPYYPIMDRSLHISVSWAFTD